MNCLRCKKELSGKSTKYCSDYCCKLYLKSLYRKRNRKKLNHYNRMKRSLGVRTWGGELKKRFPHLNTGECYICESKDNLQVHHLKPRQNGGLNLSHNLLLLCPKCHHQVEEKLRKLWIKKPCYSPIVEVSL